MDYKLGFEELILVYSDSHRMRKFLTCRQGYLTVQSDV